MSQIIHDNLTLSEEPFCAATEKAYDLLLLGQIELTKKDLDKGLTLFKEACELKPGDCKIYFEQGLSLFDFGTEEGNEKTLLLSSKKFKMATALCPEYLEAWQLWGMTLAYLGNFYEETHYFFEAEEKLLRAIELSQGSEEENLYDLYFEYGCVKASVAQRSGEAYDWQLSIEAFDKASIMLSSKNPDFWIQYGLSCLSLASLINDIKVCIKSINCFKLAITHESNNFEAWKNLSASMQFLYNSTHDEDHFSQTNECFKVCSGLSPLNADIQLEWAFFLLQSGRLTQDVKRLRSSIEKCNAAHSLDSKKPKSLACWGESLALIGELTERMELVHDGQNKIEEALELDLEDPSLWRALGESCNSLGRYFGDPDYYYQAIEKFQQGLSIDRTKHELWAAIASTYTLIGSVHSDVEILEKSIHFHLRALDLQPRFSYYHFEYATCLSKIGELTLKEEWLESAVLEFEKTLQIQKNATYLHPNWLFQYAKTLDLYAEFFEEERHYNKAIDIFLHVLMLDPDFPQIHYHLALTHSHLGELREEIDNFYKALHFFKLAIKHDEDNDQILVDIGVTLINIAQYSSDTTEIETCYMEAESKFTQAAKAGSLQAYYQFACLFSLLGNVDKAMTFLFKAESFNALPYMSEILEDEWLDQVKASPSFKELIQYLEKKESLQEEI